MNRRKKYIRNILLVGGSVCFFVAASVVWWVYDQIYGKSEYSSSTIIDIEPGISPSKFVSLLLDSGIARYPYLVKKYMDYADTFAKVKYGEFLLPDGVSLEEAFKLFSKSPNIFHKLTVIEGERSESVLRKINDNSNLRGDFLTNLAEGSVMPDTYSFVKYTPRKKFLEGMQLAQKRYLDDAVQMKSDLCTLESHDDILKLASIVEKEASKQEDKRMIAYIYMKRLRIGMRLQSCPTVLYTTNKTVLSIKDTKVVTDYNTYRIKGLPITPICNPGRESIDAVLDPLESDYLFFHADGNGGHIFSKNFSSHKNTHRDIKRVQKIKASELCERKLINS